MKKLSLILAAALLLGGISFAAPVVKQAKKAPVAKTDKNKTATKKTTVKKAPVKKEAKTQKAAK